MVKLMSVFETFKSAARGFRAGKYMLADVGDMNAAIVTMKTIYCFCLFENIEYGGPLGIAANSSRFSLPSSLVASFLSSGGSTVETDTVGDDSTDTGGRAVFDSEPSFSASCRDSMVFDTSWCSSEASLFSKLIVVKINDAQKHHMYVAESKEARKQKRKRQTK
jgi:hypothetical protein